MQRQKVGRVSFPIGVYMEISVRFTLRLERFLVSKFVKTDPAYFDEQRMPLRNTANILS